MFVCEKNLTGSCLKVYMFILVSLFLKNAETNFFIGKPMTDEDAEKFIMIPRFIDQIAYRTEKYQADELVNILGYYQDINEEVIKSGETYDILYNMLMSVMNQFGRSDWLFVKNLYGGIQGGSQIIEEMEVIIKQYNWGMISFCFVGLKEAKIVTIFSPIMTGMDRFLPTRRRVNG